MSEGNGSLAEWLGLRECADAAARSADLTAAVAGALPAARRVRALDLGTGTGSNVRYLEKRLPSPLQWVAVDRDPRLLRHLPEGTTALGRELGSLDASIFEEQDLVTASALLDLVSERWIEQLASVCRSCGAAVLFALNYDGRSECVPREPEDDLVRELFNRHQRASDKGFGAAAGPEAAAAALRAFRAVGYEMRHARSDWDLSSDLRSLQRLLIRGWAEASAETAPEASALIHDWLRRRLAHVEAGRSRIVVGHVDVGGWVAR